MAPSIASPNPQKNKRLFNPANEKRRQPRYATDDLSQIVFGSQMIGCRIHNMSLNGAMIEVSTYQVPDRFILVNYNTKKRMICEVAWRAQLHIGVNFVTVPKPFSDGFKKTPLI